LTDKCPDEPEDYDGDRDDDGCPDLKAEFDGCSVKISEKVFFKFNKWDIDPRSFDLLNDVATVMNQVPEELHFRVEGHTDSKGSDPYNKKLSQNRANSVTKYLEGRKVKSNRLNAVGFGEERPIDSNRTNDGRARNRRVEFNVSNADCKRNP
jgi:OmpA-OmpF porin, OOP family